jgi:hypothetical protein
MAGGCFRGTGGAETGGEDYEGEGAFLDYIDDRVEGSLFWRLTTRLEVEKGCGSLDLPKSIRWDGISLQVIKMVACKILGSLSHLFNC